MRNTWGAPLVALMMMLAVSGCSSVTGGEATREGSSSDVDPLFAGELPTYGRVLSNHDKAVERYMQAFRHMDACGFLDVISDVGTLGVVDADLGACTAKASVQGRELEIGVGFDLADERRGELPLAAGDVRLSGDIEECSIAAELPLKQLAGAPAENIPERPALMFYANDYTTGRRTEPGRGICEPMAMALARQVRAKMHAARVLSMELAERDGCEMLTLYPQRARYEGRGPLKPDMYSCEFTLEDSDLQHRVRLLATGEREFGSEYTLEERDGVKYYYGATESTAAVTRIVIGPPVSPKIGAGAPERSGRPVPAIEVWTVSKSRSGAPGEEHKAVVKDAVQLFRTLPN
ncbi:hypothetical protein ACFWE3_14380 [Mycobacteriaceae bacterium NPDC060252]